MALLPIRIWGDPILSKRAVAVDKITAEERRLIKDMIETMDSLDGAGLAAPQVGVSKRIFVFRRGDDVHALINPRIVRHEGGRKIDSEGCLSIPGVQGKVARSRRVIVTGRNEKGQTVSLECEDGDEQGRAATCVQHELDHLDGLMYIDKAEKDSIVWLVENPEPEDEDDDVLLRRTTPETIKTAYKNRRLPEGLHIADALRARIERK
ncbi:MAG TPA: peptide deformylase [Abditibacteriaceae bacterium]|jgi:peptide deformylase